MSVLRKIAKICFDLATTPIEVTKDIVTMGGVLTDRNEPYTSKHLKRLDKDLKEIRDAID